MIAGVFAFFYETILQYISYEAIYDRGFLIGPFIPMYAIVIFLVCTLIKIPRLTFKSFIISIFIIGSTISILEFVTGNIFEILVGESLWNYDGIWPLSFHYVSIPVAIIWGIMGSFVMYFVIPYLKIYIDKIPYKIHKPIVISFFVLLILDVVASFYLVYKNKGYEGLYYIKATNEISIMIIIVCLISNISYFIYKILINYFNFNKVKFTFLYIIIYLLFLIAILYGYASIFITY